MPVVKPLGWALLTCLSHCPESCLLRMQPLFELYTTGQYCCKRVVKLEQPVKWMTNLKRGIACLFKPQVGVVRGAVDGFTTTTSPASPARFGFGSLAAGCSQALPATTVARPGTVVAMSTIVPADAGARLGSAARFAYCSTGADVCSSWPTDCASGWTRGGARARSAKCIL